ncbi:MAG: F0F1 ATP synthase subunit epsilon [Dictyoglomi bacterium]|jgi:F0F1-type ATP synthase epsilon subunit|nr:F0F1 ATP synthase subunit epsilon [Dictyoglomota bacterium]
MKLIISSPEGVIFEGEADFISLTLVDGELGILPRRENFIGALDEGPIRIKPQMKTLFVPGGLAMKTGTEVHLMVPFAIEASSYEEYWNLLEKKYMEADERIKKLKEIKIG